MGGIRTEKQNDFWDSTWISDQFKDETEMIDRYIPKVSVEYSYKLLGDVKGKKLLEIGCGSGYQTVEFCQKGAIVTAIDLSRESINGTKQRCMQNNIDNAEVEQMSAEVLAYKDNSFDRIYINKVVLHTDKQKVLQECRRVLKKDGVLVVNEMLKQWLFSFPYRTFSPYRKSKPKYITMAEVKSGFVEHKEFYLFSTFFLFLFYLKISKKIAFGVFNSIAKVDEAILKVFPCLRKFAWLTVAWLRK